MARRETLDEEAAAAIAVKALGHLAADPTRIGRFLAVTGIGPHEIRAAAREPGFLAGVLEYYLEDESLLLAFAAEANVRPTMIAAARFVLAGDDPH